MAFCLHDTVFVSYRSFFKKCVCVIYDFYNRKKGRRKHLKVGGGGARRFEGTFSLRKTGHFLKIERALLCLLQNLGGHVPQCPLAPTSMITKDIALCLNAIPVQDTIDLGTENEFEQSHSTQQNMLLTWYQYGCEYDMTFIGHNLFNSSKHECPNRYRNILPNKLLT